MWCWTGNRKKEQWTRREPKLDSHISGYKRTGIADWWGEMDYSINGNGQLDTQMEKKNLTPFTGNQSRKNGVLKVNGKL